MNDNPAQNSHAAKLSTAIRALALDIADDRTDSHSSFQKELCAALWEVLLQSEETSPESSSPCALAGALHKARVAIENITAADAASQDGVFIQNTLGLTRVQILLGRSLIPMQTLKFKPKND